MPMYPWSRYRYCVVYTDDNGNQYLDEREPISFVDSPDNIYHTVRAGERFWHLAHRYFQGIPNPCRRWWIIAEFQPTPIVDPTLALSPGSIIVIPSIRFVHTVVFNEERRRYH